MRAKGTRGMGKRGSECGMPSPSRLATREQQEQEQGQEHPQQEHPQHPQEQEHPQHPHHQQQQPWANWVCGPASRDRPAGWGRREGSGRSGWGWPCGRCSAWRTSGPCSRKSCGPPSTGRCRTRADAHGVPVLRIASGYAGAVLMSMTAGPESTAVRRQLGLVGSLDLGCWPAWCLSCLGTRPLGLLSSLALACSTV